MPGCCFTYVWESLACFCLQVKLLFDETVDIVSPYTPSNSGTTYSAAVCELSDACDILLVRGLDDMVVDCESAMVAEQDATIVL